VVLNIAACAVEYGVAVGWLRGDVDISPSNPPIFLSESRFRGIFVACLSQVIDRNWMELDIYVHFFHGGHDDFLRAEVHDLQWILVIGCHWQSEPLRWQQLKPRMLGVGWKGTISLTLSETNIAMENGPFEDVFPMENGDIPLLG